MLVQLDKSKKKPIKRALVSVYDKAHLDVIAQTFIKFGIECVSTGSTASSLATLGVRVQKVDEITGFPECLDGRVKTLHPKIHAGILADLRLSHHEQQIANHGIKPFDLVIINLYPFTETVASGADFSACIEKIDIGGPSMVRGAAKNFANVAVVTNPNDYQYICEQIAGGGLTELDRYQLSLKAFEHTAAYDVAIANWLSKVDPTLSNESGHKFGRFEGATYEVVKELRYGENSHQNAVVLRDVAGQNTVPKYGAIVDAMLLSHGKEMSYNNYIDAEAALRAAYDHDEACVAIIKHANPCGLAIADNIADAYTKAFACDPVSAFGGVVALNRNVDRSTAEKIAPVFTEVVIAPSYDTDALEVLLTKKNLRILQNVPANASRTITRSNVKNSDSLLEAKKITGGLLVQERDTYQAGDNDMASWQLVAGVMPDADTMRDLEFAWRSVRSVKSNAILLAKDGATVGIGMGQVNRLDSCNLAVLRANTLGQAAQGAQVTSAGGAENSSDTTNAPERARGSVASSDAFFPFPDGLQILINAGVKAVVQPGGSIRDEDVIKAANDAGIAMFFTGVRHFNH